MASYWPTWSPDGTRFSYWGTEVRTTADALAGRGQATIAIHAWTDGKSCEEHSELKDRNFCGPAEFSPDGTRLIAPDITGSSILSVMADGTGQPIVIPLETNVKDLGNPVVWQPAPDDTDPCARPAPPWASRPSSCPARRYNRAMAHRVTLIPGDGIGPELAEATTRVLDATGIGFEWESVEAGEAAIAAVRHAAPGARPRVGPAQPGRPQGPDHDAGRRRVPERQRRRSARRSGCTPTSGPARSMAGVEIALRGRRPRSSSARTPRTCTPGIEHMVGRDAAESIKIITRAASERIARFAFEYAVANGRHKVTAVHKANIMKLSDGLFLESCRTVAADYEGRIEFEDRIVDNMCMQLVQKPELYDVLVLPNLYGDIVSDLCAGLVGGLGVAPGANIGTEAAVFEPVHGSAPKYAGLDKANPTAMILSGALMLRHLGYPDAADARRGGRPRGHRRGPRDDLRPGRLDRHAAASPTRSSTASAAAPAAR